MFRIFVVISFLFFLNACQNESNKGELLAENIEYQVEIGSPIQQDYDNNWLKSDVRKAFLEDVLNKAKNHKLPVYYYLSDTLIPMEKEYLADLFHHVDTEYIETESEDLKQIIYEENLEIDAIVKLKFLEQWYFNSSTNVFTKKVLAICPMVEKFKDANESLGFKGLFWIYLEDPRAKKN